MIRYLSIQEVIDIHDQIIDMYGGSFGLRDLGLLASAVEMPKSKFEKKILHPTIFDKASAYLYHICKNHPFIDGNKRTAAVSALVFLEDNEISLKIDEIEYENIIVDLAIGNINKKFISSFFKKSKIKR
jgi:death on curing protein